MRRGVVERLLCRKRHAGSARVHARLCARRRAARRTISSCLLALFASHRLDRFCCCCIQVQRGGAGLVGNDHQRSAVRARRAPTTTIRAGAARRTSRRRRWRCKRIALWRTSSKFTSLCFSHFFIANKKTLGFLWSAAHDVDDERDVVATDVWPSVCRCRRRRRIARAWRYVVICFVFIVTSILSASRATAPDALDKLCYVTSLKPHYAQQLLDAANNDYAAAMQLYIDAKRTNQLPADALANK